MSLAMWLRAGRSQRNLSLADVARITKIQPRILEKLESGQLDGLPAEVFVKGFVRSFAKCVGLSETEALSRYSAAQSGQATAVARALVETMSPTVRLVNPRPLAADPVVELAPVVAEPVVAEPVVAEPVVAEPVVAEPVVEAQPIATADEPPVAAPVVAASIVGSSVDAVAVAAAVAPAVEIAAPVVETAPVAGKKKRSKKKHQARARKARGTASVAEVELAAAPSRVFTVEPPVASLAGNVVDVDVSDATFDRSALSVEVELADGAVSTPRFAEGSERISAASISIELAASDSSPAQGADLATDTTQPDVTDPSVATAGTWQPTMPPLASTPSAPWRRPQLPMSAAYVVPTLVIDDADPDSADREREQRAAQDKDKDNSRLSFLPPILLDREDRSARQGGLTLAVIILLIAATLTLSYLMRRPSPTGDGVTMLDGSSELVG